MAPFHHVIFALLLLGGGAASAQQPAPPGFSIAPSCDRSKASRYWGT